MIVVSTDSVPGSEITEALGLVRGNAVRAKHIGRGLHGRTQEHRGR